MVQTKAEIRAAEYDYRRRKIKRVPLDMQREFFERELKPAADRAGVSVNTYIKTAITEKIARDTGEAPGPAPGEDRTQNTGERSGNRSGRYN